jgi:CBS domain containing-hemolysin-like protein
VVADWVMFGIGVVLTIGTGFFVASEFSLVNLDRGISRPAASVATVGSA